MVRIDSLFLNDLNGSATLASHVVVIHSFDMRLRVVGGYGGDLRIFRRILHF